MNLIKSIYEEPEKWRQTTYTFRHENGAQIWTCNIPILDTNTYPPTHMGLITKIRVWWAIKWWSKNAPIEAFSNYISKESTL